MGSLISLLVIVVISILITKIGSQALIHTGLSKEVAKFQARSAFTGVGYTTRESENIVNHPVRRRIVLSLMLIGNVGIISAIASLVLTFVKEELSIQDTLIRISIILFSLWLLWRLSKSDWMENSLVKLINVALKRFTKVKVKDYVELLKLQNGYEITVITIREDDWMKDKKISECKLRKEGVNILGIERKDGTYIGTPDGETMVVAGDRMMLYGREDNLRNLELRTKDKKGDKEHEKAVETQEQEKAKQKEADRKKKD